MPRQVPKTSRSDTLRRERALDAALAASFPASDPVAALEPAPNGPPRARGPLPGAARFEPKDIQP